MNAHVEPHPYLAKLDRFLDRIGGLYTAADIIDRVNIGSMQMFSEGDSIAVTQISVYPQARVLDIIAVIGDLEQSRILHDRVLSFAKSVDVNVVRAHGRAGWVSDAKKRGWKTLADGFVFLKVI